MKCDAAAPLVKEISDLNETNPDEQKHRQTSGTL